MLKAVLFDLDGTLVDADEAICSVVAEVIEGMTGRKVPCSEIERHLGKPIWDFFKALSPEIDSMEASDVYRERYDQVAEKMTEKLPHACELLEELKAAGLKIGVVSQRPAHLIRDVLRYMGMDEFVDVVASGEETEPKPSPLSVLAALKAMGVNPEEAVFVGDATFDMEAAKAAGMKTVGVLTGVASREEMKDADLVVEDLGELGLERLVDL